MEPSGPAPMADMDEAGAEEGGADDEGAAATGCAGCTGAETTAACCCEGSDCGAGVTAGAGVDTTEDGASAAAAALAPYGVGEATDNAGVALADSTAACAAVFDEG